MKNNRSLAISQTIREHEKIDFLGVLESYYPEINSSDFIEKEAYRESLYTPEKTLFAMALTAFQSDKSLKNSVMQYSIIHQRHVSKVVKTMESRLKMKKKNEASMPKKAGRPKKYDVVLPKFMQKEVSLNTAAYSKARGRIPSEMISHFFQQSKIVNSQNNYSHWKGYKVFIADGTYLQMQDTLEIGKDFEVKRGTGFYPQALLEVIIERGTGQIYDYRISNRHTSELELVYDMIGNLPEGSLLIGDDLYNSFNIFNKCRECKVDLLVPAKRKRTYRVVQDLSNGDQIIEIKNSGIKKKTWAIEKTKVETLLMRKITCISPDGNQYDLMTTILEPPILKYELQEQYLTRWDIEISIREIKTIMDINILRSKTPEMALKELGVSLGVYNIIRKIIYASIKDLPFSPKEDFIYGFYSHNKDIHIDKKGRVYSKWSSGRKRVVVADSKTHIAQT
jgi:hypothetical protein